MRRVYFLCIVLVYLLTGCSPSGGSGGDSGAVYRIATLKGPSAMGMIKLIDSLKHEADGSVEAVILNEPMQVRKMMLDGSADFALLPTTMAAIAYNRGLNYRLVGIPVWGTLSLLGTDSTVARWDQLRGRRVHVMGRGMTPDAMLRYLLIRNGLNPNTDITLDYSFPTHIDMANAVAAGRVELGVLSEPLASQLLQEGGNVRQVFDFNDEWRKLQGSPIAITAFLVRGELAKDNRNLVERIARGYAQSAVWVNQNPDSAAELMVKYGVLPTQDVAQRAIPRANLRFVWAREIRDQVADYLNVFYQMNPDIVGGKMPDEDFIF